jgi:hypothetical protein
MGALSFSKKMVGTHKFGENHEPARPFSLTYLLMADLGKLLLAVGGIIALAGLALLLAGKLHLPLGRLPGDIVYRGKHTTFYFPLATCLLLSLIFTLVLWLFNREHR